MLTSEIKVNGIMVGCVYAVNKGVSPEDPRYTKYKFEYWRPGEGNVAKGTMLHVPSDGIEVLVQKILHLVRPLEKVNVDG